MSQTLEPPPQMARPLHPPNGRPYQSTASAQATQAQRILWEAMQGANVKPTELAALVRAWCDVNEERRKLKMQPLPRSVDVSKLGKRGRKASAAPAEEPAEPGVVTPPVD